LKNGVTIENSKLQTPNSKLKNKIFVITGTLAGMSREKAKEEIIACGGKVSGTVSAKTNYLITGALPGSKLKEAQKLGVKILFESEFLKML